MGMDSEGRWRLGGRWVFQECALNGVTQVRNMRVETHRSRWIVVSASASGRGLQGEKEQRFLTRVVVNHLRLSPEHGCLHQTVTCLHEASHDKTDAHPRNVPPRRAILSHPSRISIMETSSQQPKEREGVVLVLNGFIEAFNLAKEVSSNTPAKAVFGSVNVLLTMIRVSLWLFVG